MIAHTPPPPYYAVIFTSIRTEGDLGYGVTADRMAELAAEQPGFLGMESAREGVGITVAYWTDLKSIRAWREHAEHTIARDTGRSTWYSAFKVRISKIERDYGWEQELEPLPASD